MHARLPAHPHLVRACPAPPHQRIADPPALPTSGYQKPLPAIITSCFLSGAFPLAFLYTKPFGAPTNKAAKLVRSIAAELVCYAGSTAFVLITVSDLHAEYAIRSTSSTGWMDGRAGGNTLTVVYPSTSANRRTPGLIDECGPYAICHLLLWCVACTWLFVVSLPSLGNVGPTRTPS